MQAQTRQSEELALEQQMDEANAIAVQTEVHHFQQYFLKVMKSNTAGAFECPSIGHRFNFPTFTSDLYLLKEKTHRVFSSWSKRKFEINFAHQEIRWYKHRWQKRKPRGSVAFKDIERISSLNACHFQIKYSQGDLLLRSSSKEEQLMWLNVLGFGQQLVCGRPTTWISISNPQPALNTHPVHSIAHSA